MFDYVGLLLSRRLASHQKQGPCVARSLVYHFDGGTDIRSDSALAPRSRHVLIRVAGRGIQFSN